MKFYLLRHCCAFLLILFTAGFGTLHAATYYVDFDGGNDSSPGTSAGSAWKHCPGDPNATGKADSTSLAAGDTVVFKGGVVYRGSVTITWNGSDGNPITFDGNTMGDWGTGKAIMDGSDLVTTPWTRCADAEDCGGNPNFANIYYTSVPAGVGNGWPQLLYNGTNQTHTAQDPNPSDRFLWDDTSEWNTASPSSVTSTTLTDSSYFTQNGSTHWNEAWIGMRGSGNSMNFRAITSFDPVANRVEFGPFSNYPSQDTLWSVFNLPTLIDQPGEHAVSTNKNRLYLWPPGNVHPTNYIWSIARRSIGFYGLTRNNITIRGFAFRGYHIGFNEGNEGGAAVVIINTASPGSGAGRNNKFFNNDIRFMKSMVRRSLITLNNDTGADASFNTMAFSFASGIRMATGVLRANSNSIDRITGTGIFFQGAQNSVIKGNSISNLIGTHANGISVYTSSKDVEVSYNRIYNVGSLMTFEFSTNLNVFCNLVDAGGKDQRINEWGGMAGTIRWIGNTLVNSSANRILNLGASSTATYFIHNNIIDGGGANSGTRTHNIYTGLHWWQDGQYGWNLSFQESVRSEAELFERPPTQWSLKSNSPAINAGTNYAGLSVSVDINGNARRLESVTDVGAFEYGVVGRPDAPSNLNVVD